ncbi:MAG: BrnA antitoxin family protein [Caldilineaceae bacterium]|nr:BrnA antitoxin family protein [Caldilineaceae bacterium]
MSRDSINKPSETNLARFDVMADERIDTSEVPPLTKEFFEKATWRMPELPVEVTVTIEPEVLAWFKAQGKDYQQRLAAALRLYAEAHRSFAEEHPNGSTS